MKYIIAYSEDVEHLDTKLFDTVEEAEATASKLIGEFNKKGGETDHISDLVSGATFKNHIDSLTVVAVDFIGLPDFADAIEDTLNAFYDSEGVDDDWIAFTSEDSNKLNKYISNFIKANNYDKEWYTAESYEVIKNS